MNIFHVLPLSLVKVLQANKYISHFAKLNSECFIKKMEVLHIILSIH